MSFHVFLDEIVDTAIYKVGIGGAWDSTKTGEAPAATGITALGIDHVAMLRNTIRQIAWYKSGTFEQYYAAFSVEQVEAAAEVLRQRAAEKHAPLLLIGIKPVMSQWKIVHDADYQRQTASLALILANTIFQKVGKDPISFSKGIPSVVQEGLEQAVWRSRCEIKSIDTPHGLLTGRIQRRVSKLLVDGLLKKLEKGIISLFACSRTASTTLVDLVSCFIPLLRPG